MNSYFFVRTPIQYYNALEARANNSQATKSTLVVLSDFKATLIQFEGLIDDQIWNEVITPWYKYQKLTRFKLLNRLLNLNRRIALHKILKKINKDDMVFWGNYNSIWLRYFLARKNNTVTILDDGFATLSLVEHLKNDNIEFKKSSNIAGSLESILVCSSTSIPIRRLKFFTSFKNLAQVINDRCTYTEYPFLRKKANHKLSVEKKMYFIGQPLIRLSLMNEREYIRNVDHILNYYKNQGLQCFYIPHRTSKHDYYPKHWKIKNFNFPLEKLIFQDAGSLPKIMASFYSSALYFVYKFSQNEKINFDYWEAQDLASQSIIESCYLYIKKGKFKNTTVRKIDI